MPAPLQEWLRTVLVAKVDVCVQCRTSRKFDSEKVLGTAKPTTQKWGFRPYIFRPYMRVRMHHQKDRSKQGQGQEELPKVQLKQAEIGKNFN